MYDESKAKDKVEDKKLKEEKEEKEALRKAQRLHAKRPRRGRLADERITAIDTRRATKRAVRVWRRRMYKGIDLKSVDVQKRMRLSPKNLITKGDIRLKNIRVGLDKRGIKHYHSKTTGRYIPNPFKK